MLGIALMIGDSGKGQRLAFRYPGPKSTVDEEILKAISTTNESKSSETTDPSHKVNSRNSRKNAHKDIWRFDGEIFAKLFRPRAVHNRRISELVIDNLRFLSYTLQVYRDDNNEDTDTKKLTMFSLIFILDAESDRILERSRISLSVPPTFESYGVSYPGSPEAIDMYKQAIVKLATGMLNEEYRSGYISQQLRFMLNVAEYHRLGDPASPPDTPSSLASDDATKEVKTDPIPKQAAAPSEMEELGFMLQRSELARELEQTFVGLTSNGEVDLTINNHVKVSLSIQNPKLHPTSQWRPYHTLLMNPDVEIPQSMHISRELSRIIDYAKENCPMKSFEDISRNLSIPLQQIQRAAAHLVYWRKARVVHSIQDSSMYRVSPAAILDPRSYLHFLFQKQFGRALKSHQIPSLRNRESTTEMTSEDDSSDDSAHASNAGDLTLSLPLILCFISSCSTRDRPMMFRDLASRARAELDVDIEEFSRVIVWLLQHEMIVQIHQYFYLIMLPNRSGPKIGPKTVRAGDAQPVGPQSGPADVPTTDSTSASSEAHAALLASHSVYSSQSVHVNQSSGVIPRPNMLSCVFNVTEDRCAAETTKYWKYSKQNAPSRAVTLSKEEVAFLDYIAVDTNVYRLFRRLVPYFHGHHTATEIVWREGISHESLDKVCLVYGDFVCCYYHM